MKPKHFNMLALAAIVSLIAAGVVHSSYNSWIDDKVTGQRLFPSLETKGDATGHITIQKGEETINLKKSADGKIWSIVERDGYPVDGKKVRKLVVSLGQTELIERKTKNKDLYDQLDLGDPKKKDADAKLIRLADKDNQTIAELVVGKERRGAFGAGKAGTYVRVPGDAQTWLAKVELDAYTSVEDWVQPVFFRIEQNDIKSLTVRRGDKAIYKLGPKADKKGEFELVDIPAGKKMKDKLRIADLVNGIRTLEMTDVRAATVDDGKPDMTAEIEMADGARFRIGMKAEDKKRWMTVAVLANGKDEAAAKKMAEATKGWAFNIADWRANQTFKKLEDVFDVAEVKKEPAPKTPAASQPSTPTEKAPPDPANAPQPK